MSVALPVAPAVQGECPHITQLTLCPAGCWQTLLLWLTYVCCGLADSVRGPTLMDLRDLVREDISSVASIFAFKSFGGLIGILGPGLLLDRQAGYNTDGDSPISNIHKHCNTTQGVMKY